MKPYTNQTAFDAVVKHLRTQRKRAWSDEQEMCMYRNADGCKCAIGALIPDRIYVPRYEGFGFGAVLENMVSTDNGRKPMPSKPLLALFGKCSQALLGSLQSVHDSASDWGHGNYEPNGLTAGMNSSLGRLAARWELDPSAINADLGVA